jgi:spore coat protein CotH
MRSGAIVTVLTLAAGGLTACATTATESDETATSQTVGAAASALWDSSVLHVISLDVDEADVAAAIAAYLDAGDKEWISATVTIDGTVIENVGIKLKGNSTLKTVETDGDPATLPWLVRLDKFVDGQNYLGDTELVVRGNTTETSINEAVALELLDASGLANEEAISSRFSVNGGEAQLRLVIQQPDDAWAEQEFETSSLIYKAEVGGDYSYRGDDPASYTDVFDQEAGEEDLTPLIAFLKFVNESDDATFAADLDQWLDVDSFATYLAFNEVVDNYDDISGPGNNSYLRYDEETGLMTVVTWDLNLTFGARNTVGGGGGAGGGGAAGGARPDGGGKGGATSSNVLADRFLADADFAALYDEATASLTASLIDSGEALSVLDEWTALLVAEATDLVSPETIAEESDALRVQIEAAGE